MWLDEVPHASDAAHFFYTHIGPPGLFGLPGLFAKMGLFVDTSIIFQ